MKPITKAQRQAIYRIFTHHQPLQSGETPQSLARDAGWKFHYDEATNEAYWWHPHHGVEFPDARDVVEALNLDQPATYRNFRKTVQQGFDCLMVNVSGMWIGIETDGYSHT